MEKEYQFGTIEQAIADIKAGKMVLVTDDPDRENEGDLIMAADFVTPEAINFMATHANGHNCAPCDENILDRRLKRTAVDFAEIIAANQLAAVQ